MRELVRAGPIHLSCYLKEFVSNFVVAPAFARVAKILKTEDVTGGDAERGGLFGYTAEDSG